MGVVDDGFGLVPTEDPDRLTLVRRFTLDNGTDLAVQVINLGARVISVRVPDRKGVVDDVVLGFDSLDGYLAHPDLYLGCILGRVANQVSEGRFTMDGMDYDLTLNSGLNHLNGGVKGFDQALWESDIVNDSVVFSLLSPAGDEGYPAAVLLHATYSLSKDNCLVLRVTASATAKTPLALGHRLCFNLGGHGSGSENLLKHTLSVNADQYVVVNKNGMPTSELKYVGESPYDLRVPRVLKKIIPFVPRGGYNNTLCVTGEPRDGLRFVARLVHSLSGRVLEIRSDQLCVHVDVSRGLPEPPPDPGEKELEKSIEDVPQPPDIGQVSEIMAKDVLITVKEGIPVEGESEGTPVPEQIRGLGGALYQRYGAISMVPQGYPDAVNKKSFPSCILHPGQTYLYTVSYRFFIKPVKKRKTEAERRAEELKADLLKAVEAETLVKDPEATGTKDDEMMEPSEMTDVPGEEEEA